jgi:hypothetical protein
MTEQHGDDSTEDRPGPYRGVFGAASGPAAPGPPAPGPAPYGDRPAAYGGLYGADAYQPNPPKQVTIAAVIALGLGAMCVLLAGLALTSAGEQISEVLTGAKDNQGVAVAAALFCAVVYTLPALYLRKRRPWPATCSSASPRWVSPAVWWPYPAASSAWRSTSPCWS